MCLLFEEYFSPFFTSYLQHQREKYFCNRAAARVDNAGHYQRKIKIGEAKVCCGRGLLWERFGHV